MTWPIKALLASATLLAAVLLLALFLRGSMQEDAPAVDIGGPFSLVDHHGQPVTEADFAGRPMLVYFGFTYCPDICPTTLQAVGSALDQLGAEGEAVQPVMITVDPERDTADALAEYVPNFHPRLIGLTGSPAQIAEVAKRFRVYYARQGQGDDYLMQHSSILFLMDEQGRYLAHLSHDASAEEVAAMLQKHL